ncbi:MAG: cob(I)yrinic acid a,c-diamide adenosyltransferase [Clostridia bacterium]|nr:cob(I)yrinic acid a,c-diamide adenosyltransferase [Clostridia bacterium]
MQKGCIQLYYGDGKGKTTAAMGQVVRCAGHGFKVLVYQFLKEPNSGEVKIISSLPGVEYIANEGKIPFLFNLTPEQQEHYRQQWGKTFELVKEKYYSGEYDLVVLDEAIDAYNLRTIDPQDLLDMMDNKPEGTELVITGHKYGMDISALTDRADYVTNFMKEKHPFDLGLPCRTGIEE